MSWETDALATGAPAGGEDSPASTDPTTQTPALDTASGSDTPAEQPGPVPYERFREVNSRAQQYEQQIGQLAPWQGVIERLSEQGYTGDQILAVMEGRLTLPHQETPAESQANPDAEFEAHLEREYGEERYDLSSAALRAERRMFDFEQKQAAFEQQQAEAARASSLSAFQSEYRTLAEKNPLLKDPNVYGFVELAHEKYGASAQSIIDALTSPINAHVQAQLAHYQQSKQADGAVPVTAGGGSASMQADVDFHSASPAQRRALIEARFAALDGSRR